jgi:hypothetical protein
MLPKFKVSGHRCLIFCQMTTLMTIMEDFLNWRGEGGRGGGRGGRREGGVEGGEEGGVVGVVSGWGRRRGGDKESIKTVTTGFNLTLTGRGQGERL